MTVVEAGRALVAGEVERLATGFGFTEGPVWDPAGGALLFHDIPGDARYRWSPADGVAEVARPTGKANGMALDPEGRLVVCEHATSALVRIERSGARTVLADRLDEGALNSPNDVVVRADGTIYFTDPPYGRLDDDHGVARPVELGFQGVYRLGPGPDARLEVLDRSLHRPNGLCFSRDGTALYVNDTERWSIVRFPVRPDGRLGAPEPFATLPNDGDLDRGAPDGMKLDRLGRVWVSGPGGLWVLDPDGSVVGRVAIPEVVGNLAWGGDGHDELFVCASTGLYRVRTTVAGWREAAAARPRAVTT